MRKVIFPKKVSTVQLSSIPSKFSSQLSVISNQALVASNKFITSSSPPVKVFIYTGATLSLVPLVVFALWVSLTLLGSVASAVIGVLILEGSFILIGLSVLVPTLSAIVAISGTVAITYATGGIGMSSIDYVVDKMKRIQINSKLLQLDNSTRGRSKKRRDVQSREILE